MKTKKPSLPLADLRLRPSHHRFALTWLWIAYFNSKYLEDNLVVIKGHWHQLKVAPIIFIHAIPWLVMITAAGRWALFNLVDMEHTFPNYNAPLYAKYWYGLLSDQGLGLTFGLILSVVVSLPAGVTFGLIFNRSEGLQYGITLWTKSALVFMPLVGLLSGLIGLDISPVLWILVLSFIVMVIGLLIIIRAYYLPFHLFFVWPRLKAEWYSRHPVARGKWCAIEFPGLGRLLVAYTELHQDLGWEEIESLIDEYPSQRKQALWAKTVLTVRAMAKETDLAKLQEIAAGLPQGKKSYLAQTEAATSRLSSVVLNFRILQNATGLMPRLTAAENLGRAIDDFRNQISGYSEPLASEFRKAAEGWRGVANKALMDVQSLMDKEGVVTCFKAGGELDMEQHAFLKREGVLQDLTEMIANPKARASLILYGRRRVGKSSLIRNLRPFMPEDLLLTSVSMQDNRASASQDSFAAYIAKKVHDVLPEIDLPAHGPTLDLGQLQEMIEKADEMLAARSQQMLIMVDEYEEIDNRIAEGTFHSRDILSLIRTSHEKYQQIFWMLVGSHHIEELTHADWTSFLISVRTITIPRFSPEETHLLLTEPMRHARTERRIKYNEELWGGTEGITRIHHETGGWPCFVQGFAECIRVGINNDPKAKAVNEVIFEKAKTDLATSDSNPFSELLKKEGTPDQWQYLQGFRDHDDQPEPADKAVLDGLLYRDLVWRKDGRCGLTVPLMRVWLAQQH